jgi:heme/copper-type cytochrome/quinol oxidase subunit 2
MTPKTKWIIGIVAGLAVVGTITYLVIRKRNKSKSTDAPAPISGTEKIKQLSVKPPKRATVGLKIPSTSPLAQAMQT